MNSFYTRALALIFFAGAAAAAFSQSHSCCMPLADATTSFARFAEDPAFVATHLEPLPYVHNSEIGKMVQFDAPDGLKAQGYLLPAAKPSKKWLFVFQEWWGLNEHIKREAEKYYGDLTNVNVLAIDLYDGKVATTREEAGQYMRAATPERLKSIVQGALAYAGKKARVATVGWCFGGAQSLQAALTAGKQAAACVMFYGMPEKDVTRLKSLRCDVLGIFAGREQWISPQVVAQFQQDMAAAGKKVEIKSYDAEHAFANPSNPRYDAEAAADAYTRAITYLKGRL